MAISTLGTYRNYRVVLQDCEGIASLHTVTVNGGQWNTIPLLCHTFDEAKALIDAWLAYEAQPEEPEMDMDAEMDALFASAS